MKILNVIPSNLQFGNSLYYPNKVKRVQNNKIIVAVSPNGVTKNSTKSKTTKKHFNTVNEPSMGFPPKNLIK